MRNLWRVESHRKLLKLNIALLFLCLTSFLTPIRSESEMAAENKSNELHAQFAQNLGKFSNSMYSELVKAKPNENVIYSPFSIQTCAAMARVGAVGETAAEMDRGLHLVSNDANAIADSFYNILRHYENSNILKIANKIYGQSGFTFQPAYNELVTKKFLSSTEGIDFSQSAAAAKAMNTWVESKTNNLIKDLISPDAIGADTRLVLLNAIHFKGEWVHAFKESSTESEDFYLNESDVVKVPMMNQRNRFRYADLPDLDATVLQMPYKDSDLSMLVILPNSRTGLAALEAKLKDIPLSEITEKMYFTQVRVKFPKFKAEFSLSLNEQFRNLGMKRMFGAGEFSKMLDSPEPLQVSQIIHKAFIDVNEKGTEAAAATGVLIRKARSLEDVQEFVADHPFYYAIYHKADLTELQLFVGTLKEITTDSQSTQSPSSTMPPAAPTPPPTTDHDEL